MSSLAPLTVRRTAEIYPVFTWDKPGIFIYCVTIALMVIGLIVTFKGNIVVGALIMLIGFVGMALSPQGRYLVYYVFGLNLEPLARQFHLPGHQ
jgi:tellurite resistance protein TehA-like permease